jgi:hypothetical protein
VLQHLELWRLVTWPIGLSFGGLIIGSIAFAQPGEELESMYGTPRFGMLLAAIALLTAGIHLAAYATAPEVVLAGMATLGLFVMVGYFYLFPTSSVRIFFFNVRTSILVGLMVAFVLIKSFIVMQSGAGPLVFFSEGGTGLLAGLIWFHVSYQKYPVLLGLIGKVTSASRRYPGAGQTAGRRSKLRLVQPTSMGRRRTSVKEEGPVNDEEKLNSILEKIGSKGYNSLTKDEQKFLEDYSERL